MDGVFLDNSFLDNSFLDEMLVFSSEEYSTLQASEEDSEEENDDVDGFLSTSKGKIKGIVFPAPVPAITEQSRPNFNASLTSSCHS
jgi:hypothetical protein